MNQDLRNMVCKGTELQVITNSASIGSNCFGCADYLNQKRNILKTGINVYENRGAHSLHSKAMIIDDTVCMIGSFNMDMRSAYLDTELMFLIESPYLTECLEKETERIMVDCCLVQQSDYTEERKESWTVRKQCLFLLLRLIDKMFRYLF